MVSYYVKKVNTTKNTGGFGEDDRTKVPADGDWGHRIGGQDIHADGDFCGAQKQVFGQDRGEKL